MTVTAMLGILTGLLLCALLAVRAQTVYLEEEDDKRNKRTKR